MKKKDDLEAIVDLLHEWCAEYGEEYASACIINGIGRAINDPALPADAWVNVLKDYRWTPAAATARGPWTNSLAHSYCKGLWRKNQP